MRTLDSLDRVDDRRRRSVATLMQAMANTADAAADRITPMRAIAADTTRSGSAIERSWTTSPRTNPAVAALLPMPSAIVSRSVTVRIGLRARLRAEYRRSVQIIDRYRPTPGDAAGNPALPCWCCTRSPLRMQPQPLF